MLCVVRVVIIAERARRTRVVEGHALKRAQLLRRLGPPSARGVVVGLSQVEVVEVWVRTVKRPLFVAREVEDRTAGWPPNPSRLIQSAADSATAGQEFSRMA